MNIKLMPEYETDITINDSGYIDISQKSLYDDPVSIIIGLDRMDAFISALTRISKEYKEKINSDCKEKKASEFSL